MTTTGQPAVKYENPPIDEFVCGILFDSITELRAGHFGVLWQKFGPDFSGIEDQNLLGPVSEEDMNSRSALPLPRVWFVHEDENELIQVQFNRFLHNWRKRRPDDKYPGYKTVMGNFENYLSSFREFLAETELGVLVPKRYEITYIDHILENEGWETISDLERVFPNFVLLKGQNILSTDIREVNWKMVFGLPNDFGQLQLSIRNARRVVDDRHLLRIEFTAYSNQPYKPMRSWFDVAHDEILNLFSNLISDEIQMQFWGRKSCESQ